MSLKRYGREIRGIKGGKEGGYYTNWHTNKLNIFVTIFTTGKTCTTQAQAQAQDLHWQGTFALIYINTDATH